MKVKRQNLTKDLVDVLLTYFDTKSSGLSQISHKTSNKKKALVLKRVNINIALPNNI